jgi:L-amino acid N-acyltransferase YncA
MQIATGQEIDEDVAEGHRSRFESLLREQDQVFCVWVATDDTGEVLGWQALFPFRNNPALRPLAAESNTFIRRRTGIHNLGSDLISHAISHAEASSIQYIFAFVADSNRASLRLARKFNFTCLAQLPPVQKPPERWPESLYILPISAVTSNDG